MSKRFPDWDALGASWPNRNASRFVDADTYRWHVQDMPVASKPDAPVCLLIHGTGAATHSWRDLMPAMAQEFRVIAMDLPGHGFTRPSRQRKVGLPQMARSVGALVAALDVEPDIIVGHSAGAAIGIEMVLQQDRNTPVVGLNPAILPFPGLAAKLFPTLARILFTNPFVSRIFARMARVPGEVERFIPKATGSYIDRAGVEFYRQMMTCSGHCDGAIRMMASWQLELLQRRLSNLTNPVLLVHGENDKAIPRSAVKGAADRISNSKFEELAGLGHLAHEEKPEQLAEVISLFAAEQIQLAKQSS